MLEPLEQSQSPGGCLRALTAKAVDKRPERLCDRWGGGGEGMGADGVEPGAFLGALAGGWRVTELRVICAGQGQLAGDPSMLVRFRGALGHALRPGASEEALADQPCPFEPPCGYALFHGPLPPMQPGLPMPRPFVLAADAVGADLMLSLRLFGAATDHAGEFLAAMVAAARAGLDDRHRGRVPLRPLAADRRPLGRPEPLAAGLPVLLRTEGPLVQRHEDGPSVTGLLLGGWRRLAGLAAWHGIAAPGIDPPEALRAEIDALANGIAADLRPMRFSRGKAKTRVALEGTILLPPPGPILRAMLPLLAAAHLGADTSAGAGRISLLTAAAERG